jgi:hypothetical protein
MIPRHAVALSSMTRAESLESRRRFPKNATGRRKKGTSADCCTADNLTPICFVAETIHERPSLRYQRFLAGIAGFSAQLTQDPLRFDS